MELQNVSIRDLKGGAAIELVDAEIEKCINNITDPNTEPKAVREVTLKVKLVANQERDSLSIGLQASSKLAPDKSVGAVAFIATVQGVSVLTEHHPTQLDIEDAHARPVAPLQEASHG